MNPFNRNAALWIVIVLLLALLYSVFQGGTTRSAGNTVSYSDFVRAVEQRQVQDVRISGNTISGTFREPRLFATAGDVFPAIRKVSNFHYQRYEILAHITLSKDSRRND